MIESAQAAVAYVCVLLLILYSHLYTYISLLCLEEPAHKRQALQLVAILLQVIALLHPERLDGLHAGEAEAGVAGWPVGRQNPQLPEFLKSKLLHKRTAFCIIFFRK